MKRRPHLDGEIVGRRAWKVGFLAPSPPPHNRRALVSLVQSTQWQPEVNTAECLRDSYHDAPAHGCSCGLYAYYDFADTADLRRCVPGTIQGVVTAWGDVELHPDGFRAQYAKVAALVMDAENHDAWDELARRYGVPLITPAQFASDSFIGEFGEIVPRDLRPSPRQRSRRDLGASAVAQLVVLGAGLSVLLRSVVPILAGVWVIVGMTVSVMRWPHWWDA